MKIVEEFIDYLRTVYGIKNSEDLEQAIFCGELPSGQKIFGHERKSLCSSLSAVFFSARDTSDK